MRRALLWCLPIVAAIQLRTASAAPPATTRVPVTASVSALASRVDMEPAKERARFVAELIRRVYSPPPTRAVPLQLSAATRETAGDRPLLVDVPLTPEVWSTAVFKTRVPAEQLLTAILLDRRAALLCRGLLGADDETLEFYAAHPALLTFLYERASGAFAAFAPSLRVHDGQVVVPGGASAAALWDAAVQVKTVDADAFIRALFFEPEARPAYLFDVLDAASPESRAFALGTWIDDESLRTRRFQALLAAVRMSFREWHANELPFARPLNDLALLLFRIRTNARGEPLPPAQRQFWATALDASATSSSPLDVIPASHARIDAAWLLQSVTGDMYARGDRLEQLSFGQRVFGARPDAESESTAAIVRELTTRRMLLLGLDRLGITDPGVYAAALRQARAAADGGAARFWTLAQLQGTIALVQRMALVETLTPSQAQALLEALFAVPLEDGEFRGALIGWMEGALAARLPRAATWQGRLVDALAGRPATTETTVEWEGESYRVDLAYTERKRIQEIQSHQDGPDVDVALAIARLGRRAQQAEGSDAARSLMAEGQQIVAAYGLMLVRPPANVLAPGVPLPRDGREWIAHAVEDIDRGAKAGDVRRIKRAGDSLIALSDVVLGHAMLSLVYAVHLGDPGGPALLGGSVALRHDFGFGRRDGEGRSRGPWAMPRQDFQPGIPWHVVGSLVGLEVGLAPLGLHRLSMDTLPAPPKLQSIEREAFAVNASLLNPRRLSDRGRDRIVQAVQRGRSRLAGLSSNPAQFGILEEELALDGWSRRTLRWVLQNEPASIENHLSLADVARLGDPAALDDTWGSSAVLAYGCLCTRFPVARAWRVLAGRTQLAMMAASTIDMNIEMAQRLAALRLPAALLPFVLTTAMQDYIDHAESVDAADRPPLLTYPRSISRELMADFVAATATLDGPLVPVDFVEDPER